MNAAEVLSDVCFPLQIPLLLLLKVVFSISK
jgi:hypothetical protein